MSYTVGELARAIGAQVEGDAAARVTGIAAPESAGATDLIYVDAQRYLEGARFSAAHCVVTSPEMRVAGKTLLLAAQPKLAFARAAALLRPPAAIAHGVHSTAVVDPAAHLAAGAAIGPYVVVEAGATVGSGSQIGAFCFIGAGAAIGDNCRLHPRVTLYPGARLGDRVVLHSGVVVGSDGFGYVFGDGRFWPFPQAGQIAIGNDVEIGSNSTLDRGSLGATRLDDGVKIDNLVHVAHNVTIGEHTVIAAQTGISGSCLIGRNVLMGGQAGLGDHCTIQDGAVLGAQVGVLPGKVIRKGTTVWGTPARSLDKFRAMYAWLGRLPELAERVRRLEQDK